MILYCWWKTSCTTLSHSNPNKSSTDDLDRSQFVYPDCFLPVSICINGSIWYTSMIVGTLSDTGVHSCDYDGSTAWPINIYQPFIIVNPSRGNESLPPIFHHSCRRWSNMWTLLDWWGALIVSGKLGVLGLFLSKKHIPFDVVCFQLQFKEITETIDICPICFILPVPTLFITVPTTHPSPFVDFPGDAARTIFS